MRLPPASRMAFCAVVSTPFAPPQTMVSFSFAIILRRSEWRRHDGAERLVVPAMSAEKVIRQEREKRALDEGRLLVLCDALPDSPFSSHKALGRNHTIYALGRAAIVVASRNGMGGSWHGATDCLKGGFSPVFAPDEPWADCDGNRALYDYGALPVDLSGKKTIKGQIRKKKKSDSKR